MAAFGWSICSYMVQDLAPVPSSHHLRCRCSWWPNPPQAPATAPHCRRSPRPARDWGPRLLLRRGRALLRRCSATVAAPSFGTAPPRRLTILRRRSANAAVPFSATAHCSGVGSRRCALLQSGGPPESYRETSGRGRSGEEKGIGRIQIGRTGRRHEAQLTNGYLDTTIIDWIPGMPKDLRLRDFPSFVQTTDPNDFLLKFCIHEAAGMSQASAVVINTFDELDAPLLDAMAAILPPVYTVGPLHITVRNNIQKRSPIASVRSNLWKEQDAPLHWLDNRAARSVVYVNFGSITVMSKEHLLEFAWGLANTGYTFLWNVRPDLVKRSDGDGDYETVVLPAEFYAMTEERSMLSTWCPQDKVLEHEAVGLFLTHSGWNSTLESISAGVAMLCWPFFAEQQTNCRYKCTEWGVGMEIGDKVTRTEVESLIREAMEGRKGQEMRHRVLELKEGAVASAQTGGRSMCNVDRLIAEVLLA